MPSLELLPRIVTLDDVSLNAPHDEDRRPIRLPEPGETQRYETCVALESVTVEVTSTVDDVTVEYSRVDTSSGQRWVYLVRRYSRHDPGLRAELSRLRWVD